MVIDYASQLQYHYKPSKGWINDPNGLVYFDGFYHVFYQSCPHFEATGGEPMHWGHVRTKDFLIFEELPVALYPDQPYDQDGCWSGTAIVKDDTLYLVYSSVAKRGGGEGLIQTVSIASSKDGIHFEKYAANPVIASYPPEGCPDFRDPAIACFDGTYYCVMASGNPAHKVARLLVYKSDDLLQWTFEGVLSEWENAVCAECPSFLREGDKYWLMTSVCTEQDRRFSILSGNFDGHRFHEELCGSVDCGPDQYDGQAFTDPLGRQILIAWIPGWGYEQFYEKNIGCLSVPREITVRDGKIYAYPIRELQKYLRDSDPALQITEEGFIVERRRRSPLVVKGHFDRIEILRDEYVMEVFVNGGEAIYTVIL